MIHLQKRSLLLSLLLGLAWSLPAASLEAAEPPGDWSQFLGPHGDTPDIAALIAPRPLHMNFGENDGGSPIDEVRRGVEVIRRAYESQHAEDKFSYHIEADTGHVLSDTMWSLTRDFFALHLKDG